MSDQTPRQKLADRLRSVRVAVRSDLEVTRHVLRGEPAYVVRDPLTFQSHRFDAADYAVLVAIDATRPLATIFDELVAAGRCDAAAEETFYQFVFGLHRLGFLQLPLSDDQALYRRFQSRQKARSRQLAMSFMSYQIPLWNPDSFLDRTIGAFRAFFTLPAFVLWMLLAGSAAAVVAANWSRVHEPLSGMLTAGNLAVLWITLVGLKAIHEFGHAYACKAFGVHVPEMGLNLIFGTPCAYVDATASWSLSSKLQRIIICLAGMYFESMIAAVCVFIWAFSPPGVISSAAYNAIFLASVTTVLFNINPLMRYDGYYILSDLLEAPNLRARASDYILKLAKRIFVGVRAPLPRVDRRLAASFVAFGVSAGIYRGMLMFSIVAIIASKLYLIGLLLGLIVLAGSLRKFATGLFGYLWFAEETAPVRTRAVALSAALIVGVPALLGLIPVRTSVQARAVLGRTTECVVRADAPGFVEEVAVERGAHAVRGAPLAALRNLDLEDAGASAASNAAISQVKYDALLAENPGAALQELRRLNSQLHEREERAARIAALHVAAPLDGEVVDCLKDDDAGRYLHAGDAIATIVAGNWELRTLLTEEETAASEPRVGDAVEFRPASQPECVIHGIVTRLTPSGSRSVQQPALTHLGGGDIAVTPDGQRAAQPYFELTIALPDANTAELRYGMTGRVSIVARREPIGIHLVRRVVRFLDNLRQS